MKFGQTEATKKNKQNAMEQINVTNTEFCAPLKK